RLVLRTNGISFFMSILCSNYTLQRFVAATGGIAFVLVDYFPVRAQAIVAVLAPINALPLRNGRVPLGFDEKTFPVEERATILTHYRKRRPLHGYAFTPAACSSARLIATRASW